MSREYIRKLAWLVKKHPAITTLSPINILGILHRSQADGYVELVNFARANPPPDGIGEAEIRQACFGSDTSGFDTEAPTKNYNKKPK